MKKKMYKEAIEDCHRLLNIDKRNVGAYFIIGSAYEKLEEVDVAIENFTIVLELDPTHVNAMLARGAALNKIGHYKQALDDYDNALKLDSEKSKFKKSRNESRRKLLGKDTFNEEDIMRPNENKFKPLEVDTSHIVHGHPDQITQGNTEILLQKQSSSLSLNRQGSWSNRIEDCSFGDVNLSYLDSSK